jgi:hypothetical protein
MRSRIEPMKKIARSLREHSELILNYFQALGMTLSEGKTLLASVQDFVIAQQAHEYLEQRRPCAACGRAGTRAKIPSVRQSKQYSVPSIDEPTMEPLRLSAPSQQDVPPYESLARGESQPGTDVPGGKFRSRGSSHGAGMTSFLRTK